MNEIFLMLTLHRKVDERLTKSNVSLLEDKHNVSVNIIDGDLVAGEFTSNVAKDYFLKDLKEIVGSEDVGHDTES